MIQHGETTYVQSAPLIAEGSPIKLSSNIFLGFYSHYQVWRSSSESHTCLVSTLPQSHIHSRPSLILYQFPTPFSVSFKFSIRRRWIESLPLRLGKPKISWTWKPGNSNVKFTITIWTWQSFRNSVLCTPALIIKQYVKPWCFKKHFGNLL